jgi:hypothetical protein
MLWLCFANSFVMDFLARKKVALSMSYTVLDSLPFPRVPRDHPLACELVPLGLKLTAAAPEMIGYWNAMADQGWVEAHSKDSETPPGLVDLEERSRVRAKIDAVVAQAFELDRSELEYVLDSFPVVRRRDESSFGEYRTKRMIMEQFEAV